MENTLKSRESLYVRLLACIQFSHIVDFVVLMPLGPTLMESLGITPVQFASLVSSYNFSAGVAGFLFATIADKFDRKKMLMICLTGFIVGTVFCGLAPNFNYLLGARIVTGIFGGILNALVFTIASDLVPPKRRGNAMGLIMASFSVASVLGVPIGLSIADATSWHYTFYFIAFFTLFIYVAAFFVFPNMPAKENTESALETLKRFGQVLGRTRYLSSYLLIFIVPMSMFLLIPFLSPFSVKNIGIDVHDLKYMYLIGGACTIVSARLIGKLTDRFGALNLYNILVVISTIPVYWYTHTGPISFGLYLVLSALFMTMVSGRMIPCMTLISMVPCESERGSFMSLTNSIRSIGSASSTFLAGLMISEGVSGELVGFGRVGLLSIALMFATIVIIIIVDRKRSEHRYDSDEGSEGGLSPAQSGK